MSQSTRSKHAMIGHGQARAKSKRVQLHAMAEQVCVVSSEAKG